MRRSWTLLVVFALLIAMVPVSKATAAARGAWAPYVNYAVNDTVTYGGQTYRDIQAHTSLPGWEPPVVPALWELVPASGDTQAPAAPGNLRATATTSSSIALAWDAATDNVGVTGYTVYRSATPIATLSASTLTYTHTGLAANTTYSYTVRAQDAAGNMSADSNTLSVKTNSTTGDTQAPTVPANVTVTATTVSSVSLSWSASSDNVGVTGYDVYQGAGVVMTVTGTSAVVSGLAANTTYSFKVTAKDAAGNTSAASAAVTATTKSGSGGQLPKHTLTGYWQNFVNGATNV